MRQLILAVFRALDFDIQGLGAGLARGFQDLDLLFDAAGETALILPPPAGSENHAIRILGQELSQRAHAPFGRCQVIQAEFEETLAAIILSLGVRQQRLYIRESQGNTDARENSFLPHERQNSISCRLCIAFEASAVKLNARIA